MGNNLEVKGKGFDFQTDLEKRLKAMKLINEYDTTTLECIVDLLNSKKARDKFKENRELLKTFI